MMFKKSLVAMTVLGLASVSWGHLDSLRLNGAVVGTTTASLPVPDTFSMGQQVPITFATKVSHNGTTVFFRVSRDNGATWEAITSSTAMNAVGPHTYMWTVSGPPTTQARIRIFHSASPNPEGMIPNDYTLISGQFGIRTASSLRPVDFARALSFNQTPNAIQVGGSGIGARVLRVDLSDSRGVLLREGRLTGNGAISIPTSDLSRGRVFLRVWSDDKSLANRAFLIQH